MFQDNFFFKKEIVEEKNKRFMSVAIASIARANDKFSGLNQRSKRSRLTLKRCEISCLFIP